MAWYDHIPTMVPFLEWLRSKTAGTDDPTTQPTSPANVITTHVGDHYHPTHFGGQYHTTIVHPQSTQRYVFSYVVAGVFVTIVVGGGLYWWWTTMPAITPTDDGTRDDRRHPDSPSPSSRASADDRPTINAGDHAAIATHGGIAASGHARVNVTSPPTSRTTTHSPHDKTYLGVSIMPTSTMLDVIDPQQLRHDNVLMLIEQLEGEHKPLVVAMLKRQSLGALQAIGASTPSTALITPDNFGCTAVHWAAILGRVDVMPWLENRGLDLTAPGYQGLTPAHLAALVGAADSLAYLLSNGMANESISLPTPLPLSDERVTLSWHPFHAAILAGNTSILKLYFEQQPDHIPWEIPDFGHALHLAVYAAQPETLRYLLTQLQDPGQSLLSRNHDALAGSSGLSVLSYAAVLERIGCLAVLLAFYRQNPTLHEKHRYQEQPIALCYAIQYGVESSVQYLLAQGVDVAEEIDVAPFKGQRPCDVAAHCDVRVIQNRINTAKARQKSQARRRVSPAHGNVRRLALSGGGVKGIVHAGALSALADCLWQHAQVRGQDLPDPEDGFSVVEAIAGTSAGAIAAGLVAVGYRGEDLARVLKQLDIATLVGSFDVTQLVDPERGLFSKLSVLAETMDESISYWHPLTSLNRLLSHSGVCSGADVLAWLEGRVEEKLLALADDPKTSPAAKILLQAKQAQSRLAYLTLGELGQLAKADPCRFKHVHIIASRLRGATDHDQAAVAAGIVTLTSETSAPAYHRVLLVDAIRASMSFPGVFEPYVLRELDDRDPTQVRLDTPHPDERYVDGGMLKNYAVEAFDRLRYLSHDTPGDVDKPLLNPETLGFRIVEEPLAASATTTEPTVEEPDDAGGMFERLKTHIHDFVERAKQLLDVRGRIAARVSEETRALLQTEAAELLLSLMNCYLNAEGLLADYHGSREGRTIKIGNAGVPTLKFALTDAEKSALIDRGQQAVYTYFGCQPSEPAMRRDSHSTTAAASGAGFHHAATGGSTRATSITAPAHTSTPSTTTPSAT